MTGIQVKCSDCCHLSEAKDHGGTVPWCDLTSTIISKADVPIHCKFFRPKESVGDNKRGIRNAEI